MSAIKIKSAVLALLVIGCLAGSGCKKKEEKKEPVQDTEQETATDNNVAEFVVSDIEAIGSELSEGAGLSNFRVSGGSELLSDSCATWVIDASAKIAIVDFGTTGCLGKDGRTRYGKLTFDFSGSSQNATYYRNPGFKMVVTSQNYVVDNYQVNIINKTVENTTPLSLPTGTNPGTNLTWAITASISIVKPGNGGNISWSCSRFKELVNTSDPNCYRGQSQHIIWNKAIVKLNGQASGTNARSESFTSVATDLVRDFSCTPYAPQFPKRHPFISGTLAYTPGSRPTRLINFGSGVCDALATVTIRGSVFNIVLP